MVKNNTHKDFLDWGYDTFIGREVCDTGFEAFVTLDLHSTGSCSYLSLTQACNDLYNELKDGKKVLLSLSPGKIGPTVQDASKLLNILNDVLDKFSDNPDDAAIYDTNPGNRTYVLDGRTYAPFKPDQMALLKKMYCAKPGVDKLPDPFDGYLSN